MDGVHQEDQPPRAHGPFVVRQALVAIVAAFLAIGAISIIDRDDADSTRVAPDSTLEVGSTDTPSSVTASGDTSGNASNGTDPSAITVPLDTDVVEDQSNDEATTDPASDSTVSATPPTAGSTTGSTIVGPITITAPAVGVPSVDAKAYAVYDATNNRWLAESGADTPMPVGSVMKLLTSYVVLQAGDLGKVVTVPRLEVDIQESAIGLYEGEQLPRDVLLRAMLIVSANDAARTLAIDVGGSIDGFVSQMNAAAQALGMTNTVAANPIGLDAAGAHSSAHDMVSLAALLMQDQTFRDAVVKPSANLHGQTFSATNDLLTTYDGATGVKTGRTTQAGYCLIGSATRDGRQLIVAVLGAQTDASRLQASTALLDWGFSQP